MAPKIKMVYVCVGWRAVQKQWGAGRGEGQLRSVLGTPQVGGHFMTFLVDRTTVDTFFAHQQD